MTIYHADILQWAEIESFDFSPDGLCENCGPEFREPLIDADEVVFWWDVP